MWLSGGTINAAIFSRLIERNDVGFTPVVLHVRTSGGSFEIPFDEEASLSILSKESHLRSSKLLGSDSESFALTGYSGQTIDQLLWELPRRPADLSLIESAAQLPGFLFAYLCDAEDVFWQSETSLNAYDVKGRDHSNLPKLRGAGFFPWETETIDVSRNPGRERVVGGMLLLPAATMWFGPLAFTVLDRKKLLSLESGRVFEEGGVIRVDLFPFEWYAQNISEMRDAQARFAAEMGFDELEADPGDLPGESDPAFEINEDACSHGGARQIVEWLDATGSAPVRRSEADRVRITEFSLRGDIVHREEREISPHG